MIDDGCRSQALRNHQGFAGVAGHLRLADAGSAGWRVFDLESPIAVVDGGGLDANIRLMSDWCHDRGASLAPHTKTTMSPEIVERQLEAGAFGVTVATAHQLRSLATLKPQRVIVASENVNASAATFLAGYTTSADVLVFADSAVGVEVFDSAVRTARSRPLGVLLEVGAPGGRTGVRSHAAALEVARAVSRAPGVTLRGVSGFEGLFGRDRSETARKAVSGYLDGIAEIVDLLRHHGHLDETDSPIVSAGGSAYFDLVVDQLSGLGAELVLRSGCYVTHDSGLYRRVSPLRSSVTEQALTAALHVWAQVISAPEDGVYVLNAGRREVSTDIEPPLPELLVRPERDLRVPIKASEIVRMSDHHTVACFVEPRAAIGDWVRLGVSHPCTTFDKWRVLAMADGDVITDVVHTHF